MAGLYDQYRLSNSTVVPQFTGTTAPEALQVGQYLKGLYDTAQSGANEVSAATDNLQNLDVDNPLADEVRNKIQGDISKMSASRDWENYVEPVRQLGRYYANRSTELARPVKQFQDYQKSLDDDKLGLTPQQKQAYVARSKAGYKGLQKDNFGRFVGGFQGVEPAKNMDTAKWADDVMKGMKEFKDADSVVFSNGMYIIKKNNSIEYVTQDRVQRALDAALATSTDMQAHIAAEGDNAGFYGSSKRYIDSLPDNHPAKQQAIRIATQTGMPVEQVMGQMVRGNTMNGIKQQMSDYVRTKYAYHKNDIDNSMSGDPNYDKDADKSKGATVVTDSLDNPATDFGSFTKDWNSYNDQKGTATQVIERNKAIVGRYYDEKNGKDAWSKLGTDKQEQQIQKYYKEQPGGASLYGELQKARSDYDVATRKLTKIKEAEDIAESYVLNNKFGMSKEDYYAQPIKEITSVLKTDGDKTVRVDVDGTAQYIKSSQLATMLEKAKFDKTKTTEQKVGSRFVQSNSADFVLSDGRKVSISDQAVNTRVNNAITTIGQLSEKVDDAKKKFGDEAMQNYSQSGALILPNDETLNKNMWKSIRGGEKVVYQDGERINEGSDTDKEVKRLIEAGDFEYLGMNTDTKDPGNIMVKVSVRDKAKKDAKAETYHVSLRGTNAKQTGLEMIKAAKYNPSTGEGDQELYNAGVAVLPNSPYNKINRSKLNTAAVVKERKVVDGQMKWVPLYTVEKSRVDGKPTVVIRDQNGAILPLTDQLDIGARLYEMEQQPGQYKVDYK